MLKTSSRRFLMALLAASLLVAATVPVSAAPGNNGTVKIHNGDALVGEPSPEIQNEPHVGCFHAHFFFSDTGQTGLFWIDAHPPTGGGTVYNGSYDTGAGTEYATEVIGLAAGHYKLYWQGDPNERVKHKTFWVDEACDGGGGGGSPGG